MGSNSQRIIWYGPLVYQRLDGDIQTYAEFVAAFDAVAASCRARGREKVHVDPAVMLQWLRNNGHENNDKGRRAYGETLDALHVDIDHVPKKQSFAAANFQSVLGPVGPINANGTINYQAMGHMDPCRR
jgi:hypothetical protein